MASQGSSTRKSMSSSSFHGRKKANEGGGGPDASRKSLTASRSINGMFGLSKSRNARHGHGLGLMFRGLTGERMVKQLRLSKALTVPESTSIYEA